MQKCLHVLLQGAIQEMNLEMWLFLNFLKSWIWKQNGLKLLVEKDLTWIVTGSVNYFINFVWIFFSAIYRTKKYLLSCTPYSGRTVAPVTPVAKGGNKCMLCCGNSVGNAPASLRANDRGFWQHQDRRSKVGLSLHHITWHPMWGTSTSNGNWRIPAPGKFILCWARKLHRRKIELCSSNWPKPGKFWWSEEPVRQTLC